MKKWLSIFVLFLAALGIVIYQYVIDEQSNATAVKMTVQAPEITDYNDAKPRIYPVLVTFDAAAAPLKDVHKSITEGVKISPNLVGEWTWVDDRTLSFLPQTDWQAGREYEIKLAKSALIDTQTYQNLTGKFNTAAFTVTQEENEFYQDPVKPDTRFAAYRFTFSHPINKAEFEQSVSLKLIRRNKDKTETLINPLTPEIRYDEKGLTAYVNSPTLGLANADNQFVRLAFDNQLLEAAVGGEAAKEVQDFSPDVAVPTKFSLTANVNVDFIFNRQQQRSEQLVGLNFNQAVKGADLAKNIKGWLLPLSDRPGGWVSETEQAQALKRAEPITLEWVPTENPYEATQHFRIDVPEKRQIVVEIDPKLTALGGYQLAGENAWSLYVDEYPEYLSFVGEGALLSTQGDRKIAVVAQNIDTATAVIGRVQINQLRHLAALNQDRFENPDLGNLPFENIATFKQETLRFPPSPDHKPVYGSLDLSDYKRGVFWLKLSTDDEKSSETYKQEVYPWDNTKNRDYRLVVLSDLGLIAKKNKDGGYQLFVQSIEKGTPLVDVRIEVISAGGKTLAGAVTNEDGVAEFPAFPVEQFNKADRPVMFIAGLGDDLTFLPFSRHGGNSDLLKYNGSLDYSRFDIGGVEEKDTSELESYVFSDRGIYRAGETVHFGVISKAKDWTMALDNLPLEAVLTNSRGDRVENRTIQVARFGLNSLDFDLPENAVSGQWTLNLYFNKDDDETLIGSATIQVQDFQPDSMKLNAQFAGQARQGWYLPAQLTVNVQANNLYGTPAQQRLIRAELAGAVENPTFMQYPHYRFYASSQGEEWERSLPEKMTDTQGKAVFDLDLSQFDENTVQRLYFTADVFETAQGGGRAVSTAQTALVSARPFMLGYRTTSDLQYLRQNQTALLHFVAVDPELKQIAPKGLSAVLLARKTLSVLAENSAGKLEYQVKKVDSEINRKALNIDENGLEYALPTEQVGDFVLEIRDIGDKTVQRIPFNIVGNSDLATALERNQTLQLRLNKKAYKAGDDIELSILAPYIGSGLITLERDRVYAYKWFTSETPASVQTLRVPDDFEGSGYINVQFIRSPNSDEVFSSPLSYAVVPFAADTSERRFPLTLTVPQKLNAGEPLPITLKAERSGKAIVFAVDEGILQVADYQLAHPLDFFFQKAMLKVSTFQLLDLILPSYTKVIRLVQSGGDASIEMFAAMKRMNASSNPFKRKTDKPVTFWSGIIDFEANKAKSLTYPLPAQFNGAIRVMAVALDEQAIATAEAMTQVQSDIVLTPNLPTVMTPGDEAVVTLNVANTTDKSQDLTIELKQSAHFERQNVPQQLTLAPHSESAVKFSLKATTQLGSAPLTFVVNNGTQSFMYKADVSVRPLVPQQHWLKVGKLAAHKQTTEGDLPSLFPTHNRQTALLSNSPLVLAQGVSHYLANYDNYCTEQIISMAMPKVLFGRSNKQALFDAMASDGANRQQSAVDFERNLQKVFAMLVDRQNYQGAFGVWNNQNPSLFLTAYAFHFMLEANEHGIAVPSAMYENARSNLLNATEIAERADLDALREYAYATYVLTLSGEVTTDRLLSIQHALEQNYKAEDWQGDLTSAWLAGAYRLLREDSVADELFARVADSLSLPQDRMQAWLTQDLLTDDAMLLYLFSRHAPSQLERLETALLTRMSSDIAQNRYNTLSSAWLMMAFEHYQPMSPTKANGDKFSIQVKTEQGEQTREFTDEPAIMPLGDEVVKQITFSNQTNQPAWFAVSQTGYAREAGLKALVQGLEVERDYLDKQGKPVNEIKLGDEIDVVVKVRATQNPVNDVVITDFIPAGFEVLWKNQNDSNDEDEVEIQPFDKLIWMPDYTDIREDRVLNYGNVDTQLRTFKYRLRAAHQGRFHVPPVYAESMYLRQIKGQSDAKGMLTVE